MEMTRTSRNRRHLTTSAMGLTLALLMAAPVVAQAQIAPRQAEYLNRAPVAVPAPRGVLVSWRKLYDDAPGLGFNLYRDGKKLNTKPVADVSNWLDEGGKYDSVYSLRPVLKGKEDANAASDVKVWGDGYLSVAITPPADGVTPDGQAYSYTANDLSVGDVDGDGQYELILKWDPTNSHDNSQGGYTGNVYFDAYRLNGERLWRIDMGRNIRAGAHYTQFLVFDFDGDGKAEIAMKTADGTVDGTGAVIGDAKANWVSDGGELEQGDRTGSVITSDGKKMAQFKGRILKGPEYLSVFSGLTGKVLDTVPYLPSRDPTGDNPTTEQMKETWGDGYGNRSERYLAGVAYLDGVHPSAVFARGYYARTVLAAFDFKDGKISNRWVFDSKAPGIAPEYSGEGNHQLSVADVDGNGTDEIIYGSIAISSDGKPLWAAKLYHGDAMHVSDLDPTRPGLEKFGVHEDMGKNGNIGSALLDARTGEVIWKFHADKDTGRGVAADIDPRYLGAEAWGANSGNLYNIKGEVISDKRPRSMNFRIWWDGDLLEELLDGNTVSKWDWLKSETTPILVAEGTLSNNGTKSTPNLSADIIGDWREEVILRATDNKSLRIYSTNFASKYGFTTLMQDPQYRLSIAWQNVAYNQPPHTGFYLGDGMKTPPKPNLTIVKAVK
jgi:rhamnogalacturonan endolyase